ncbi:MAG: SbcC/MukB-like Walker B domain-containing protein, partial [Polyangiaceae bacterium]
TASEAAKKLCAEAAAHLEKARESQSADHQHTEGLAGQLQAEQLVGSTRATLESVRAAWTRGQAVVLARDLEDGGACPVCGSTDHPAPASGDEDVPEQKAIDSAETSVRQAEANLERIAKAVAEAKASAAASRAAVKTLRQGLGDAADTPLDDLQERAEEAARVFELADAAARALPGLKKASEVAGAGAGVADKMLGAARDARAKADTALGEARAIETEVGKSLPKALRAPGALEEAVAEAKAKLAALVEALETATVAAQTARESQAQAQTRVDETKKGLDTATERDAEAAKDWADALGKSGFEDDDDFQDARREDAEITVLDQEIRAWDEATARADERLKKAKKEAKGVVPPDLAPLDAAAKAATEEHAAGVEKLGGERNRVKTLEAILDQLREIEKDRAGDLSEQKIIGRLAQTADGKNGANMSFERFVLAAFLEDVLRAATGRLRKMSGGRYALHRATGGGDGRMKGGLDLDVLDAYTGRSRPVGTLSGGEGFEASLALALGMADVVQAQSGGIHLDAIFVDEGFGSLGSEDLDAVIGALEDLQEGGRLVGVISHVTELAERIPARLEVDKGRSGSSARFVVP